MLFIPKSIASQIGWNSSEMFVLTPLREGELRKMSSSSNRFFFGGGVNFLKHINSPLYLFLGQVHATDYSNASATGIFDSYQVWHMYCVYSLFLWCEVLFLFLFSFFISLSCNFITDVLEWISLLAGLSASLHFPQSRKHRVSQPFPSNTN